MMSKWPAKLLPQVIVFFAALFLGAVLIDGFSIRLMIATCLSTMPAFYFLLWVNRPEEYITYISKDRGSDRAPTLPVLGQSIPLYDVEDREEERFLRTHGDFSRRTKKFAMLWTQLFLSYIALFFILPGITPGGITVCVAGLLMILSYGQGHLLLIPAIQAIFVILNLKVITAFTPFILVGFIFCFFSLLIGSYLIHSRGEKYSPFEFMLRGSISTLIFISVFLLVDLVLPSEGKKWWEKALEPTISKASVNSSSRRLNLGALPQVPKFGGNFKLPLDLISGQLDQFGKFLDSLDRSFGDSFFPELSSLKGQIRSLRTDFDQLKKKTYDIGDDEYKRISDKLLKLQGDMNKLEEKLKLLENKSSDQMEKEQLKSSLDQLKSISKDFEVDLNQFKVRSDRAHTPAVESKSNKNSFFKRLFSTQNMKRFFYISLALVVLLFIRKFFKKFKSEELVSEEEINISNDIMSTYKKEKRKWKSREEEVLKSYSIFHGGMERLYYEPRGIKAPPPGILSQEVSKGKKDVASISTLFSSVKYGQGKVLRSDLKEYRKAFKRVFYTRF